MTLKFEPDFRRRVEMYTPRWMVSLDCIVDNEYARIEFKNTNMIADVDLDVEYPEGRAEAIRDIQEMIDALEATRDYIKGMTNDYSD